MGGGKITETNLRDHLQSSSVPVIHYHPNRTSETDRYYPFRWIKQDIAYILCTVQDPTAEEERLWNAWQTCKYWENRKFQVWFQWNAVSAIMNKIFWSKKDLGPTNQVADELNLSTVWDLCLHCLGPMSWLTVQYSQAFLYPLSASPRLQETGQQWEMV